ncbi:hypothetical protein CVT26_010785 [Gymnopilus dilepis]|uniref:F-box domain-containing protein n=1 Tax=Gymnopilus dilepis TaxID=231916 RepID=A0A409VIC3_9AGAR|nr:hypothetical protein CVT26_010785 [Gymnopilus dilepis]
MDISALHDHLLQQIFKENADISSPVEVNRVGTVTHDDFVLDDIKSKDNATTASLGRRTRMHALTTTVRSLSVCRHWYWMLTVPSRWTSSLWGGLLDLDVLSETKPEVIQQILARAGNVAPLSVKGTDLPFHGRMAKFAFDIVRDHWDRLEWVDISIHKDSRVSPAEVQFWKRIATPAKRLRRFFFTFSDPTIAGPVMLKDAPNLKEFHSTPSSPLLLNSSWVSQLTHLSIDSMGYPSLLMFDFPSFLNALHGMRNLENLGITNTGLAVGNYKDHRMLKLTNLRSLTLKDEFNTCFAFLRHLSPSPQCRLDIHTQSPRGIPDDVYWAFDSWMERYLPKRKYNDRILIDLQPSYGEFVDAYPDCLPAPTIRLRVDYVPGSDKVNAESLFGFLPRGRFSRVKNVWFRMNLPIESEDFLDSYDVFFDFYGGLDSAEVLKTTLQGFQVFTMIALSDPDDVPMPRLKRVRIIYDKDNAGVDYIDPAETTLIGGFIQLFRMKRRLRQPIRHLDVRGFMGDFSDLDVCKGLRVTWKDKRHRRNGAGEYICGSGDPENNPLDVEDYDKENSDDEDQDESEMLIDE